MTWLLQNVSGHIVAIPELGVSVKAQETIDMDTILHRDEGDANVSLRAMITRGYFRTIRKDPVGRRDLENVWVTPSRNLTRSDGSVAFWSGGRYRMLAEIYTYNADETKMIIENEDGREHSITKESLWDCFSRCAPPAEVERWDVI